MRVADFKLERYFAQHEFSAPYLLCCSDCETLTVEDVLQLEGEEAKSEFMKLGLGYTESPGSEELRQRISGIYEHMEADDILVTSGAEEAIFLFMNTSLAPGDHVIVHYPYYQSLGEVARSIGCEVSHWQMAEADGWKPDLASLIHMIKPHTRAVIVNMPHNPTGYLCSRQEFANLVEILRERNILLFSDEVYRLLEYHDPDRLPAACDVYENAVSLGVMSKAYGLAGLRIGWVASRNQKIIRGMAAFKDYTTICNSAPSEFLAAIALKHSESVVRRNLDIIKHNLLLLDEFFVRFSDIFTWNRPKAGPIAFPSVEWPGGVDAFCSGLVAARGILLLPASCFGFGSRNFRIGFGRQNMPEALEQLQNYLQTI